MKSLSKRRNRDALVVKSFFFVLLLFPGVLKAQLAHSLEEANRLTGQVDELISQGRYREAIPIAERALAGREKFLPPNHPIVIESRTKIVGLYLALAAELKEQGRQREKALIILKSLAILEKGIGPNSTGTAEVLEEIASIYHSLATDLYNEGLYWEAIPIAEKCLATLEKSTNPNKMAMSSSLNDLAVLYQATGDYGKAEPILKRSLAIMEKAFPSNHPDVATSLNNLAVLYQATGDYGKAEPILKRSLAIMEKAFPSNHPGVVTSLNNLAVLYQATGDYGKAEPLYQRILANIDNPPATDNPIVAQILNNTAALYETLGDYNKAEPLYQRALAIRQKALPSDHPDIAHSINNLAGLYLSSGRVNEAYRYFMKKEIPFGLGACHLARREYGEAANQYEKALKPIEKYGEKELIIASRIGLGLSYEGLKGHRKAMEEYQKAVDLIELQREALEPASRERFLSGRVGGRVFMRIQAYEGLARCLNKLGDHEAGFKISESTKARVLSEAISRRGDANILRVPENVLNREAGLTNSIAGYHKMLEKLFQNKQMERHKKVEKELEKLREEHKAFIPQLRKDYPEYAAIKYPIPLSASEVKLNAREVLLSYQVTDQGVISYLVRDGKVVSSDLLEMERKKLEELVKEYRSSFETVETYNDLKKYDPKLSRRLYELVLAKHLSQVNKQDKLIIVPDGVLALLPFEALVMEENPVTYVGDSYDITYAHSGTSLTLGRTLRKDRKGVSKNLLVLADPVFTVTDARIAGKVQVAKQDESQTHKEKAIAKASMGAGKAEVFPRLVITGKGAERLGVLFKGSADSLTGLDARKEVFLQKALDQYKYLALLTHGILDNELPYVREPALVLTQVNTKNGFLTMTEVMGLNLNCEVAALTACSTGIGRRVSGEGVMHMGRGFQYAGAKSVLMSLWQVAEDSTTYMTERFFTYLKDGQAPSSALRQARRDLRIQSGGKYDHPYFWAPFILVGEGQLHSGLQNMKEPVTNTQAPLSVIKNPSVIVTGAGVYLCSAPRSGAPKKSVVRFGTVLSVLDEVTVPEQWYRVSTYEGTEGWLKGEFAIELNPNEKSRIYVEISENKIENAKSFGDLVEVTNFLTDLCMEAQNPDSEFCVSRAKALRKSFDAIPVGKETLAPYAEWINKHKN